jgi:flavin reductase (DIM6/NTAB) family NADH-FMN oxidoreductase RutF
MSRGTSEVCYTGRLVTPELFKQIAGSWLTGVAVVTAVAEDGELCGMTMSAVTSLSLDPPQFLVCMDKRAKTLAAIGHSKAFCIHFLSDQQQELSNHFARRGADRFTGVAHRVGETGVPILEGVIAYLECRLVELHPGGDHSIVIGDAVTGAVPGGQPLTYFRGGYRKMES